MGRSYLRGEALPQCSPEFTDGVRAYKRDGDLCNFQRERDGEFKVAGFVFEAKTAQILI